MPSPEQHSNAMDTLIARYQSGDLEGARADCERHLARRSDDIGLLYLHGLIVQHLGEPRAALASIEHALTLRDTDVSCLNLRGEILLSLGDSTGAQASFECALASDPVDATSCNNLAVMHYQQGDLARSLDYLVRGLTANPNDTRLAVNGARILAQSGRDAEAVALIESFVRENPLDMEAVHTLNELCQAQSQTVAVSAGADGVVCGPRPRDGTEPRPLRGTAPRISIVLPLLSTDKSAGGGIEAIVESAQKHDFECILVDGGIEADLRAALEALQTQSPVVRIIGADPGTELHAGFNLGAAQSRGDLLLFLRPGLKPAPGWLEALLAELQRTSQACIVSGMVLMAPPGTGSGPARVRHCGVAFDEALVAKPLYEYCLAAQPFVSRRRELQAVDSHCMMLRRELFTAVGGFDAAMGQAAGLDICLRVRKRGGRVVLCPEAGCHEIGPMSSTATLAGTADYERFLAVWRRDIQPDEGRWSAEDGLLSAEPGLPRLAMVTPLTPQKTGVAHYVQELLPHLAQHARVDLFVDDYVPSEPAVMAGHRIYLIRDLDVVAAKQNYQHPVYQIGNNRFHSAVYRAALRNPGVVVLHEYDCKGCSTERTNRELLTKLLGSAKGVIIHNEHSRSMLAPEFPQVPFGVVPHILADTALREDIGREAARSKLGLPESPFVVLSLGLIQSHKRNHVTLEAFARFAADVPDALLILAGEAPDPRYARSLNAMAARLGIHHKVILTGWVSDEAFFDYLYAADVTVNLRYPARGEESGSLTRILGCGRPALVSDYAQFAELPDECVVKIGFDREVESITEALARLHADADYRSSLSVQASTLLRNRNAGPRVGGLYADFCLHKAGADAGGAAGNRSPALARIHWTGPVWAPRHPARELILALDKHGVGIKVSASSIPLALRSTINPEAARRIAELSESALAERYVQVFSGSAGEYRRDDGAHASIVMVCDGSLDEYAGLDADSYWVPSEFVRGRLSVLGVATDRVQVVPYGVPGLLYSTSVFEKPADPSNKLLLCVTDFSSSDGWKEVLLAFLQEYGGRADVGLLLKLNADVQDPADIERICVEKLREFRCEHPRIPLEQFKNVQYDRQFPTDDELPEYYRRADAVLISACTANFGRSLLEVLALGIPVITTVAAGHAEIVTERCAAIVPIARRTGLLDVAALREHMRTIVDNGQALTTQAILGRSQMLEHFTWADSARRASKLLALMPGFDTVVSAGTSEAADVTPLPGAGLPQGMQARIDAEGRKERPYGFNVIGYVSGNLGIGVTARNIVQMLIDRGFPTAILDLDPGLGRYGHDKRYAAHTVASAEALPYAINLLILPPAELATMLNANPAFFRDSSRLNVGFSMWELPVLSEVWKRPLESLDALVAESEFIRYAFQFNLSRVLTLCTEHPLYLPAGVHADRRRFGLPEDGVLFIMSFEPFSDPARKNPFAVIDAFIRGLADNPQAHLVIKLNNANCKGAPHPILARLHEHTGSMQRVHIIDRTFEYREALSLYASCDVYVSLHRAEGLGLGMLEAMLLEKPVIATAWSGNMSFMDHTNACLVGYRLVPVDGSIPAYSHEALGTEARWAEADIGEAAEWMRRLCGDAELRLAIGRRAGEDARRYHARACEGRFLDEIRAIWGRRAGAGVEIDVVPAAGTDAGDGVGPGPEAAEEPEQSAVQSPEDASDDRHETLTGYALWQANHALTDADITLLRERISTLKSSPHFHVMLALQRGHEGMLADTIDSLGAQLYTNWSLTIIADYPPPDPAFESIEQVRWVVTGTDCPYAAAVGQSLEAVDADWLVFMQPGDRLASQALAVWSVYADRSPHCRFIYSDEDTIDAMGASSNPQFKPDFNLDLLRAMPYIGNACVMARSAVLEVGGCADTGRMVRYDLALRILDAYGEKSIGHVADPLYHAMAADGVDPHSLQSESAQLAALRNHLARNGLQADVQSGVMAGTFMVDYRWERAPRVSIIIPTRDRADLLSACVGSVLQKTSYADFEVIIVDNDSSDSRTHEYFAQVMAQYERVRVIRHPGEFNFSAINNAAARHATGEFLLLLNNDTMILQPNWLERMVNYGLRPDVGVVGVRLVQPDQRVQHAGIILGMGPHGIAEHVHIGMRLQEPGYMGRLQVAQNLSAVTAACMLVHKDVYEEAGGMDDVSLKVLFNDVDLCLKIRDRGYRIVWTPHVTLLHHGSISVKQAASPAGTERALGEIRAMQSRWLPALANDPSYNRNLSLGERIPAVAEGIDAHWTTLAKERQRVLGFGIGSYGSWQYRVVQPLAAMDAAAVVQAALTPFETHRVRMPTIAELERLAPDVLLMHNTLHDVQIRMMAEYKRVNKSFIVFGEDDLMYALPKKNPFSSRVYKDMKKRMRQCLSVCDRVVVTTGPLADALKDMADDVRVVPNYLDDRIWASLESLRRQGDRPRVGWAGAMQHGGDLEILEQVVRETADEVDWVFFGMCPEAIRPFIREFHKPVPFECYPQKLASLNLDLAVAPLEHNSFNEAKSNLRILEYGVLGWPVICTNIYPYQDGPVMLVANNARAWTKAIRDRVNDLDAAAREGDALRDWVKGRWMLDDHLEDWLDALSEATVSQCKSAAISQS